MTEPRQFWIAEHPNGGRSAYTRPPGLVSGQTRVHVREVIRCEWNADGLVVKTACGHEFRKPPGALPREFLFCNYCGGPISGGDGLEENGGGS